MPWRIEVTPGAAKQIRGLGPVGAARIRKYLRTRLESLEDPRQLGKPLIGSASGNFWRYRVGDYRLLSATAGTFIASARESWRMTGMTVSPEAPLPPVSASSSWTSRQMHAERIRNARRSTRRPHTAQAARGLFPPS